MRAWLSALVPVVLVAAAGCASSPAESADSRCAGVVCAATDACHVAGVCDPGTGTCSNPVKVDGAACDDGNACTQTACHAHVSEPRRLPGSLPRPERPALAAPGAAPSNPVVCTALDQCHTAGTCDPGTGTCSNPVKVDGAACDDGNACTQTDTCQAGACVPSNPVVCTALDQCHTAGTCDPGTGTCSNPAKTNGTACQDGNACTQADTCQAGVCVGVPATCSDGQTCNPSSGVCEGGQPVVSAVAPPDGTTGVDITSALQVTFSLPMNPATLTAQATPGACTGSLQVSTDGFASCIGLNAPVMSGGDTVVTSAPVGSLSFGTTYRARITIAAQSAGGQPIAAEVVQANGFTTRFDAACGTGLVISQVYGGGGNTGGLYRNDYVELHNPGTAPVAIAGMALQLQSAAGLTNWTVQPLPVISIPAGGHFLVQEAVGVDVTQPALPLPDFTPAASFNIASTSGKVAITSDTVPLVGSTLTIAVVDMIGFGSTASAFETAAGPAPSAATAVVRRNGGCSDGNNNSLDFVVGTPTPRNSQTPAVLCACTANETNSSSEMDFCSLQWPASTATAAGVASENIYARVFEDTFTQAAGANGAIACQIGYGARTVNPSTTPGSYLWTNAIFNVQVGNEDEYKATLTVPVAGIYGFCARCSRDFLNWTYCDLNGAGSNAGLMFEMSQLGSLTVTP